ncbi:MAG: hypothetical protein LJE68_05575 [Rhodobacter sp.]|jgi:hypothetical protein|nr:hypothetical protein [Rhodobacter sp.]
MKLSKITIFGVLAASLLAVPAVAHQLIPSDGWVCTVKFPRTCYAYNLKHPPGKVLSNPVVIYKGGNHTGYQPFHWQVRK